MLNELIKSFVKKNESQNQIEISKSIERGTGEDYAGLVVYAPHNLAELNKVIDCVCTGQTVILNMGNIKNAEYNKIADYLCGALYALNADINCLQDALYVVTPKNVKLSTL